MTKSKSLCNIPYEYRTDALRVFSQLLALPITRISLACGQTNNITATRWIDGHDIYLHSLLNICNKFKLDPLSFLTYEGKAFTTNLGDIVKLEKSGLHLRDLLNAHGVTPCIWQESATLSGSTPMTNGEPAPVPPLPEEIERKKNLQTLSEVLDHIVAIQCEAHRHEQEMLNDLRKDMQRTISERDKEIGRLKRELKTLQARVRAAQGYFAVHDESEAVTEAEDEGQA